MERRCGDCIWMARNFKCKSSPRRPKGGSSFECRLNPPLEDGFPIVEPNWWCGKFTSKEHKTLVEDFIGLGKEANHGLQEG
jgi:hypothetical protein